MLILMAICHQFGDNKWRQGETSSTALGGKTHKDTETGRRADDEGFHESALILLVAPHKNGDAALRVKGAPAPSLQTAFLRFCRPPPPPPLSLAPPAPSPAKMSNPLTKEGGSEPGEGKEGK